MSLEASYEKMMSCLRRLAEKNSDDYNDQDVKFVRMMIPHHEAAVEMAEKQIKDGKSTEIIDLAKGVKKTQNDEIDGMRKWLDARGLSAKEDEDDDDHEGM